MGQDESKGYKKWDKAVEEVWERERKGPNRYHNVNGQETRAHPKGKRVWEPPTGLSGAILEALGEKAYRERWGRVLFGRSVKERPWARRCEATATGILNGNTGGRCRDETIEGSKWCQSHYRKKIGAVRRRMGIMKEMGRYYEILPKGIREDYARAMKDPRLLEPLDEVALLQARLSQLVAGMPGGDVWGEMRGEWERLVLAQMRGDRAAASSAFSAIDKQMKGAMELSGRWTEIYGVNDQLQRMKDVARKREVETKAMIPTEQVMVMVAGLADAVRRHVRDEGVLKLIQEEFYRLTGGGMDKGTEDEGAVGQQARLDKKKMQVKTVKGYLNLPRWMRAEMLGEAHPAALAAEREVGRDRCLASNQVAQGLKPLGYTGDSEVNLRLSELIREHVIDVREAPLVRAEMKAGRDWRPELEQARKANRSMIVLKGEREEKVIEVQKEDGIVRASGVENDDNGYDEDDHEVDVELDDDDEEEQELDEDEDFDDREPAEIDEEEDLDKDTLA